MDTKQVVMTVLISTAVSVVVTSVILYVGMRQPLPLIDTVASKATFEEQNAAKAA